VPQGAPRDLDACFFVSSSVVDPVHAITWQPSRIRTDARESVLRKHAIHHPLARWTPMCAELRSQRQTVHSLRHR